MIYRDERRTVEGVHSRKIPWTAPRHVCLYGESLADVEQWLAITPRKWNGRAAEDNPKSNGWDLGAGYANALALAKDGWHEGVEMLDAGLQALVPATGRSARWGYAQTGGSVSIGRYLAGHPKNMRNRRRKDHGAAPVLHIVVNVTASCGVRAEQMVNYGIAMTGLIDRLENTGKRFHLDCVFVAKGGGGARVSFGWNVKQASEPVDLSQVAFALAHPAALRRLGFAMLERTAKDLEIASYGAPADGLPCDIPDHTEGTLIVDGVNVEATRCNSPQDALRLAIEQINKAAVIAGHSTPDQPLIDEDDWLN